MSALQSIFFRGNSLQTILYLGFYDKKGKRISETFSLIWHYLSAATAVKNRK